jgi:hypothetical protein
VIVVERCPSNDLRSFMPNTVFESMTDQHWEQGARGPRRNRVGSMGVDGSSLSPPLAWLLRREWRDDRTLRLS